MEGNNGKDDGEPTDDPPPRSVVDDPSSVPEEPVSDRLPTHQPSADKPSTPPPPAVFHDHSASLPVVLETEGDGEGDEDAADDQPSQLPVGSCLSSHQPGANRPPVHPASASVHDNRAPLPKALDDHAIPNACNGTAGSGIKNSPRHRRSQSEVVISGSKRTNSFQNFKSHIQRAWKWGGSSQEESSRFMFNPEVLADQKRQWCQLQSKCLDRTKYKEPNELFEHLIVTGLSPEANLEAVEQAFARKKKRELAMARTLIVDEKQEYRFPSPPSMEPQMLYKYPPGKKLPMGSKDLCAFCFPGGVKARMVERTPSLSDLNELVYGQGHLGRDDMAFIFSLKVADNASLYGVCLLVPEIVQRPPSILGGSPPFRRPEASRFLVSAPRCYCLLTRVPFFELHFEMLNSIVSQERLDRITHFFSEVNVTDRIPSKMRSPDHFNDVAGSPFRDSCTDWMSCAIPVDSAVLLSASAAGLITDDEVASSSSATASEASFGRAEETNNNERKNLHHSDNHASVVEQSRLERPSANLKCGLSSPGPSGTNIGRSASSISLFSGSATTLEGEDDGAYLSTNESDLSGKFTTTDSVKESKTDFLKIVCAYKDVPVPGRGSEIVFHPLEHLQTIQYRRPAASDLGLEEELQYLEFEDPSALAEVSAKLAAAEEAAALSIWTIATICRALSLDNILALVTGVLLEKQVVVTCPNLGVLSAVVLSLIPIIQPFEWQSLLLPILPEKLLDFLDAPVPFLVGIQQKPVDIVVKSNNLIYIDVFKDQRNGCDLPLLPEYETLSETLRPVYDRLFSENSTAQRQHVYRCSETQVEAAMEFKDIMRHYMDYLCSEIRLNTITSVQSNDDRVSILLKDSFIDSFPETGQPFMKMFIETQMFSVLSDFRLSRVEQE